MIKFLDFIKTNKIKILLIIILIIGFTSRLVLIDKQPNALNVDEASAGYDAWSILNYGIDRNGKFLPVFLIAWGSGQNALYSYIMIPFIKTLGLSALSIRLPMAIIGCISLVVFYLLIKELKDEKTAIIGLGFFVICPWHIMKSRWGLESNIFPDMVLWSVYLMILSLKRQKISLFYIAAFILRINCLCLWNIIFFSTIFYCSTFNYIAKAEKDKIKRFAYIFGNCSNCIITNNIMCFYKYI